MATSAGSRAMGDTAGFAFGGRTRLRRSRRAFIYSCPSAATSTTSSSGSQRLQEIRATCSGCAGDSLFIISSDRASRSPSTAATTRYSTSRSSTTASTGSRVVERRRRQVENETINLAYGQGNTLVGLPVIAAKLSDLRSRRNGRSLSNCIGTFPTSGRPTSFSGGSPRRRSETASHSRSTGSAGGERRTRTRTCTS